MAISAIDILAIGAGVWVPAELHDDLTADDLFDVEDQWAGPRQAVRAALRAAQVPPAARPESLHWDWGRKASILTAGRDPADVRVMGVRRDGAWEAAMVAGVSRDLGGPLVYIDYVEVAPWNWSVEPIGQRRRHGAVGSALIRAAVLLSHDRGFGGRVGLHALPRAEPFYLDNGFRFVRRDADKEDLAYYERSPTTP